VNPITFTCRAAAPQSTEEIRAGIADLARWSEFHAIEKQLRDMARESAEMWS
jgi:hypothetical protein